MLVIKDSSDVIYPADLCTWKQADATDGYGYVINTAKFYGTGTAVALVGPELGHIGKSGRFVKMTAG
jgi:hypothetical protein